VARPDDRPVALRFPRYGPLFVKFGDGTVGAVSSWSSGRMAMRWRSAFRVRDFDAATNMVCVLTEEGDVGCIPADPPRPLQPLFRVPTGRFIAIARDGEVCVTTTTGATRCHRPWLPPAPSVAERMFNAYGKLRKIVPGTNCGIDLDGRLVCLAAEREGAFVPKVVLDDVLDASLVPNGPYEVSGCVVTKRHTVACWGANRNGEVGSGSRSWGAPRTTVPGLTAVAKVSYASGQACALRSDGALYCWGTGFGPDYVRAAAKIPRCRTTTTKRTVAPCPARPPGAGPDDPCARLRWRARRSGGGDDSITVVHRDARDQCIGPGDSPYTPTPTRITIVRSAIDLAARERHAFFLREDGVVVGVGSDARYDENALSAAPGSGFPAAPAGARPADQKPPPQPAHTKP
jgi:hypothetical protein